jgi:hypothetical protein
MTKIAGSGSGSISQRHGSADPDPHQNVMDPQHWIRQDRSGRENPPVCGHSYLLTMCHKSLFMNVSVRVADPDWIQIQSGQWIRIRIRKEGKNDPQK